MSRGAPPQYKVEAYTGDAKVAWDECVRRSRTSHFLFLRDYMDYHADRFRDGSLIVVDGARVAAVMPGNVTDDTLVSHGGLTFGGVISDTKMTADRMLALFDAVSEHLRARGVSRWVYKAVPHIYSAVPAEEDLYALFRVGARLVRRDVAAAIAMTERLPYGKGRKHSVKRARDAGLEIGRDDAFAEFIALEKQVLESRHGVAPVHTAEEMTLLAQRFPDNIKLFVARREGRLLAGVIVYETPYVAHAQYMGAADEGRE